MTADLRSSPHWSLPGPSPLPAPSSLPAPSGRLARPVLLPGLRRLWRGRHVLQLGVDPARAVVLELPDPAAARLLDLLDGVRSERSVIQEAERRGIRATDSEALLHALRSAGLVVGAQTLLPQTLPDAARRRLLPEAGAIALRGADAPGTPAQLLRRRGGARVLVAGHGRLIAPVALVLAHAGVGHVRPELSGPPPAADPLFDLLTVSTPTPTTAPPMGRGAAPPATADGGRSAEAAIADAIVRTAPGTRTGPIRRGDTSFVVQVGGSGPAVLTAAGYAGRRLAHLAVTTRDGTAVIGPLVPPIGGPCLNCLDLHRQDRDPDWPHLSAQLLRPPDSEPCGAATVLAAAGIAAGEVLSWIDGSQPATLGGCIELAGPGQLRRRSWPAHPHCRCTRSPRPSPRRPG